MSNQEVPDLGAEKDRIENAHFEEQFYHNEEVERQKLSRSIPGCSSISMPSVISNEPSYFQKALMEQRRSDRDAVEMERREIARQGQVRPDIERSEPMEKARVEVAEMLQRTGFNSKIFKKAHFRVYFNWSENEFDATKRLIRDKLEEIDIRTSHGDHAKTLITILTNELLEEGRHNIYRTIFCGTNGTKHCIDSMPEWVNDENSRAMLRSFIMWTKRGK